MDGLEVLIEELERCIHVPYKWGGNNPLQGLDCSGLVCWGFKRIGMLGFNEDLSAQGLLKRYWDYRVPDPVRGALVFFGPALNDVRHVAVAISEKMMIEAGGGNKLTLTLEDAAANNAMVRIQPIFSRKDLVAVSFPEYPYLG